MTAHQNAFDANAGQPNLGALQYLQENWGMDEISSALRVDVVSDFSSSGTSGVAATNIPVGATIIDVVVHAKATVGSGTARVRVGGGGANITDAMVMATEDAIVKAATIDQTYKVVGADGIEVVTHSNSDEGDVYIYYKK